MVRRRNLVGYLGCEMACYHPLDGYRLESGGVRIGFEPEGSRELLRIPCGRCLGCRMDYASSWALRLQHEAACWDESIFVTLTYDDECLPWHRGLVISDLQRFLKRFRKEIPGDQEAPDGRSPVRFFAAGEYGSTTDRPHWHVALFNARLPGWRGQSESDALSRLWPAGMHTVSRFSSGRAGYLAGYCVKKVRGRVERERRYGAVNPVTGEWFERRPEFAVMSRRPGIGRYWFDRYRCDLERGFVIEAGGVKRRLPRFYKSKLMEDDAFAEAHEERVYEYQRALEPGADSEERRRSREKVHASRLSTYGSRRM